MPRLGYDHQAMEWLAALMSCSIFNDLGQLCQERHDEALNFVLATRP
jgi:hypothetical protein